MKILLISPEYPPHNIGGGGIVVKNIAENLVSKKHEVIVATGYYPTKSYFEKVNVTYDNKIKVIWLPLLPLFNTSVNLKTVMPPNIFSILKLINLLKEEFDIIHVHGYGHILIDFAALFCAIKRKNYILTIHGFPSEPFKNNFMLRCLYNLYTLTLGKLTLCKAKKITAISKSIKNEIVDHGGDINKIIVIPNGFNINEFQNIKNLQKFRKKYKLNKKDYLIGCIGILHKRKGFQYLIKALPLILKHFDNVKLVVIGNDGGYEKNLKESVKKLNIKEKVIFTGFLDSESKKSILKETDIIVIPSLVEPFGLVALESMALEKPIIATKVGGLKEIFKNQYTAILVKPHSSKELADSIIKIFENKELASKLVRNAKYGLKNYDLNKITDKYLYNYILVK